MEPQTITFTKDKETKNAFRFVAPQGNKISGSIYVDKELAGDKTEVSVVIS